MLFEILKDGSYLNILSEIYHVVKWHFHQA
jgi:hypothetical protein